MVFLALLGKARGSSDIQYLASPVTGGGISVGRLQQLFLLARALGQTDPAEWARYAWHVLSAQEEKLLKDGKVLETTEENMTDLLRQARAFAEEKLPILEALQIA